MTQPCQLSSGTMIGWGVIISRLSGHGPVGSGLWKVTVGAGGGGGNRELWLAAAFLLLGKEAEPKLAS